MALTPGVNGGGIVVSGGNNFIEGNYLSLDATGANATWNASTSISDSLEIRSANNTIGGTTAAARNVIAAKGGCVRIGSNAPGNKIQGNYLGTDAAGTRTLSGPLGVIVDDNTNASNNQIIGGTVAGAGNVIASPNGNIRIFRQSGLLIQGNFIGTNAAGTAALTTTGAGVSFSGTTGVTALGLAD